MTVRMVHRPTRTTKPLATPEPETLAAPPPAGEDSSSTPMQFLLPVIGAMSSVVMMVVMRNGNPLFLMVGAIVFVVAIVGGLAYAISSRGRGAKERRKQRELYLDYLENLRDDLRVRRRDVRDEAITLNPRPGALASVVRDPTRLWERRRGDSDHLQARIGTGTVPWFDLAVPSSASPLEPQDAHLRSEAERIADSLSLIPEMPVTVDLRRASVVAVIGEHAQAASTIRALLMQLCAYHSPDDVEIGAVFDEERAAEWRGLDLLPHVQDSKLFDGPIPARRIAPDVASLRSILSDSLAERAQAARSAGRGGGSSPLSRLFLVMDDHGRIASSVPLSDSALSLADLHITVIHLLSDRLHEPRDVDVRITVTAEGSEVTTNADTSSAARHDVTPDAASVHDFAGFARSMAALRVSQATREQEGTTRAIDITELLGIENVGDVAPETMWAERSPADFLRVPFAIDDGGSLVRLDLKESAQFGMGPHGICIGATGSGKSEMLRTLLLALAVSHPPEDLTMILVDYKGGAAFAPFDGLPHLAGLIDNLADDPQLTTRAKASIQGEVVRRQKLLKDADSAASITHYREMRRTRPELPPMPHLFVVIDEFGELLTAEPDFIDLFLQIGRIGRSIGVHLLLSSQRIEGGKLRGLDTYLSYRLGLRTFSESESQVVLNTADAFHLPAQPGFGYLKVDTSVYTRFRAGYVSGPVPVSARPVDPTEETPRPLALPVYNGIEASSRDRGGESTPSLTRPDVGVQLVDALVERLRVDDRTVRPVWLPPLPERVHLGPILDENTGRELAVPIGLVDDPAQQDQSPWILDLTRAGGHVAIIGGPQSGRSTLLRTIGVSLALTKTPRDVAVYGMDLTGGGLKRLEGFPHVGGVATRSSRDQLRRLIEELTAMLNHREQLFAEYGIDGMSQLRQMHAQGKLPAITAADIVVLVDGYGAIRQDFDELEDGFVALMLRASSFGIHLVLGLTRWSELRIAHQALFGTKVELRLNDASDSTIDRKLSATLSAETPGRAITDAKLFAHTALPVLELDEDEDVSEAIEALAQRVAQSWTGPSASPIRLLPHELPVSSLPEAVDEPDAVPLGLRQDSMETAHWDFLGEDQHLVVFGDTKSGKSSLLRLIAQQMMERFTDDELVLATMDIRNTTAPAIDDDFLGGHARNAKQAHGLASSIASELEQRAERDAAGLAASPRIVLLIDDYDIVGAGGTGPLDPLVPFLPSARDLKLHLVVARPVAGASRAMYERALQVIRDTGGSVLLLSGERSEGQILPRVYAEQFPPGRGRFVRRGERPHVIQVAHAPDLQAGEQ